MKGSSFSTSVFAAVLLTGSGTTAQANSSSVQWTNPFPVEPCNGVNIKDITVAELQRVCKNKHNLGATSSDHCLIPQHFANGSLTSVQLTQCYVDRINKTNPYVHHVIEINPDWKAIAQGLDAERANGTVRGPLHGIPVLTKDNIATADKVETTGELERVIS